MNISARITDRSSCKKEITLTYFFFSFMITLTASKKEEAQKRLEQSIMLIAYASSNRFSCIVVIKNLTE